MHHSCVRAAHQNHAFAGFDALTPEGLAVRSRRNMLKASLAGVAGLSLPQLLQQRAQAAETPSHRSVILLWMTGGPSHIDTWDPKPHQPYENRGPFSPIQTSVPGTIICEHLPLQAAMMDKFTILRSVDPRKSSHEPNQVFQTGHLEATPRTNPKGGRWPAIGSIVGKFHGSNHPAMPPYVAFMKSRTHCAFAGYLGKKYDPFIGNQAASLPAYDLVGKHLGYNTGGEMLQLSKGLSHERLLDRTSLRTDLDRLRRDIDQDGSLAALDSFHQQAFDMILGRKAQEAFDLSREPESVRQKYGDHLWCQQALLARRLVESGVAFVTLDLSYHTASGTWDTHGDNIPPYGGIEKGLKPLLPLFDHLLTTLVSDLDDRGLLDEVLVIAMGEFGRTPNMGTQGSTDGRNHWPYVMSMCLAGGGMKHGQVIGASDRNGGQIASRPVIPGDLAATIYRHMGVPLEAHYEDDRGRPHPIVQNNGKPIAELF
ncbi:DUF1501 domain-containing protein [Maioricimonas sp. JC845]|uniref:DUF1501 domain-containing protein n=1 Tax=Maioricimonas sp. JC845 TaxID=3232138 RepID=UPI00345A63A2